MVLKLVGAHMSTCTRRVKVVAYELGIDLKVHGINFAVAEHKTPEYLEKQPFGQVPYLDDDGFIVFESRAIGRYLALKYGGGKLLPDPSDVNAVAKFEQAVSVEAFNFDPFASGIGYEKVFHPAKGVPTNDEILKRHIDTLKMKMEGYERILSKQKYLAGDELTVADLFHLPYGEMAEKFYPDLFTANPNVAKWWSELKARDSWAKANVAPPS